LSASQALTALAIVAQIHHLVGIYKLLFPVTERALTPDLFVRIRRLLCALLFPHPLFASGVFRRILTRFACTELT